MSGRGRVCFYSELAYPLIARDPGGFAGGAESQIAELARGLVERDYEVRVVTCDYGQPSRQTFDGVEVLRAFAPNRGIPILRFFHPRLSLATAALLRADAEAYYVCGSGMPAGLTGDVARLRGAGFVLATMTDYDVLADPPRDVGVSHRAWFLRALRHADRVLSQTEYQRAQLERNFGVKSEILPNLVEIPRWQADPSQHGIILWLATYKPIKRPEWFVALARDLPEQRFVMAGIVPPPPLSRESWDAAAQAARELPNLEVLGFQDRDQQAALQRRASLLVHTSPVEGFSNVLLESWAAGLPTVSSVNPDGLVTREGLGWVATEYSALRDAVRDRMADPEGRREAGARARAYAQRVHAAPAVFSVLTGALDEVIGKVRRRRGTV